MGLFNWWGNKGMSVERSKDGTWSYMFGGSADYSLANSLELSLTNPALFTAFDMRSTMFGRAKVSVINTDSGEDVPDDPYIKLLENPNFCESKEDHLKKHLWFKGLGTGITKVIPNKPNANVHEIDNVAALEHLIPSQVDYGETSKYKEFAISRTQRKSISERIIRYNASGEKHEFKVDELAFFYDIACNMKDEGLFKSPSRIEALKAELKNIQEAQESKNKNLKFSGKWLAINKKTVNGTNVNMDADQKREIEGNLFHNAMNATNANVSVEALANDFRKLMLDDNISSDAMRVFGAYDIPRAVLNWWKDGQGSLGSGGTEQEMAVVNWIQNSIQVEANDYCNTWETFFGYKALKKKIIFDYSHLPVMQVLETKRIEGIERQSKILDTLVKAGMSLPDALRISGLDETEA